jgi:phosphocarrier protein FPr
MLDFTVASVRTGAVAKTKEDAIRQVSRLLVENGNIDPGYASSMMEREALDNTYLGNGIAIPHGLPADRGLIRKTGIAVVQFPDGVEWQPSQIVRLAVGIAAKTDEHLDLLAKLTELLSDEKLVEALASTPDAGRIVAALTAAPPAAEARSSQLQALSANAISVEASVGAEHGLHARPATNFATRARGFQSAIQVHTALKRADGKTMASLLLLGAEHGTLVRILADGPDAARALEELKALMEAGEVEEQRKPAVEISWKPVHEGNKIAGVSISPGLAIARIHLLRAKQVVLASPTHYPAKEKQQLRAALAAAHEELQALYEQVSARISEQAAQIFLAQSEFLRDETLIARTETRIDALPSASYAWHEEIDNLASSLAGSDNAITSARAADIRDIGERVLRHLLKSDKSQGENLGSGEPVLLVAQELTPSQTAAFNAAEIAGFCTVEGSATSHVAILARSLDIPAITGIGEAMAKLEEGQFAILDAVQGVLYLDPAEEDIASARLAQQSLQDVRADQYEVRFQPALTTDDARIEVCANIGRTAEAAQALEAGGEGVGLLRTEFLFFDRKQPPSEEEQYLAYREMLQALDGLPLILRTLDIGGDKNIPYINQPHEENPFLGVRGIRLCLRHPELFRTQLRAAYRASVYGNLKLMFPMIATPAELTAAKEIAEEIRAGLGVAPVEIGTMIEVPAAVIMADELAREVDFFSIGTNDLTQYVLAMDRGNASLAREAQSTHPAVLRMIAKTVEAAARHGKWVGVCGGLAGDPVGAAILIGLGVTELSMDIPSIPAVKAAIRTLSKARAQTLAQQALACDSTESVLSIYAAAETRMPA